MRRNRRTGGKTNRARGPRLYQRNGIYWFYLRHGVRGSLFTTDPTEARQRFAEKIKEDESSRANTRPGEETIEAIAEKYLRAPHGWTYRTLRTNRLRVSAFQESMSELRVTYPSQIATVALGEWRQARMKECSRVTINRDEVVARSMLRWAREQKLCNDTPLDSIRQLREPRRKASPLIPSPGEIATVVATMETPDDKNKIQHGAALTIATSLACGLRLDELRHIRPEWIGAGSASVIPETGPAASTWMSKGFKERRIPISESSARVMREFAAWIADGTGGKGKPIGLSDTWIAKQIDKACKRCDVPIFRMHDVRRTFATECVRSGIPITTVRDWMGHRDVQTTERYFGRYREDELLTAPTPAALEVFGRLPADVVPITRAKGSK